MIYYDEETRSFGIKHTLNKLSLPKDARKVRKDTLKAVKAHLRAGGTKESAHALANELIDSRLSTKNKKRLIGSAIGGGVTGAAIGLLGGFAKGYHGAKLAGTAALGAGIGGAATSGLTHLNDKHHLNPRVKKLVKHDIDNM